MRKLEKGFDRSRTLADNNHMSELRKIEIYNGKRDGDLFEAIEDQAAKWGAPLATVVKALCREALAMPPRIPKNKK
jgi:hypothetical protein